MTDFYITIDIVTDDLFDEDNPRPGQSVLVLEYDDKRCYLYSADDVSAWPPVVILAAWEQSGLQTGQTYDNSEPPEVIGSPTHPIHADYWNFVRPLGNGVEGRATGPLRTKRWQGHPEARYAIEDVSEYPAVDAPFQLKITRDDYGSEALPWDNGTTYALGDFATSGGMWQSLQDNNTGNTPFGGSPFWEFINQPGVWGWTVEMISNDPLRDITARAIGVYSDPECTSYLYTTGAFIQDGSHDNNFYTECPIGQRQATDAQVNFALLLGSAQEGWFNLPEGGGDAEALFWNSGQLNPIGGDQPDWMRVTKYGPRYGGTAVDGSLFIDNASPMGFGIESILVQANNKLRLTLFAGAHDDADPTITFRRLGHGATVPVGMIWSNGYYISGVEAGMHDTIKDFEGKLVLIDVGWA